MNQRTSWSFCPQDGDIFFILYLSLSNHDWLAELVYLKLLSEGAFTPNVKSVLSENLDGILGGA